MVVRRMADQEKDFAIVVLVEGHQREKPVCWMKGGEGRRWQETERDCGRGCWKINSVRDRRIGQDRCGLLPRKPSVAARQTKRNDNGRMHANDDDRWTKMKQTISST